MRGVPLPEGTRVVIAAGTGLGEAILFWDGKRHLPVATEGGHADFAPQTDQQAELWKFLKKRFEFVSNEIILAGRGFQHLHEFLNPDVRHPGFDDSTIDPAPEITRQALDKSCPVCVATLDLWVEIYGSEAGNLAIRTLARGGIYVAGGIAVKILSKMKDGNFAAAARRQGKDGRIPREHSDLRGAERGMPADGHGIRGLERILVPGAQRSRRLSARSDSPRCRRQFVDQLISSKLPTRGALKQVIPT